MEIMVGFYESFFVCLFIQTNIVFTFDTVSIEESEVYSNSWWSSSAESAIVLAQSKSIDESTTTKMRIVQNKVYDNINKIP